MDFIEKSINNIEKQYNNKKNKKRLILLLNRYYLGFLTMDKTEYLNKAYNCCAEYLNQNKSDFEILLAIFFFSINIGDKTKIEYFNSNISKYKKYLKNNDIEKYSFYIFLQGFIKARRGSIRGTIKYIKVLQSLDIDVINIYIVFLKQLIDNLDRDILLYIENIEENMFWKNIILYNIFERNSKFIKFEKETFKNYVKWALYNGIDIENSIFRYENSLILDVNEDMFNIKLYKEYNFDIILSKICELYLENNIHTKVSYFFYKEAINRQIVLKGLNTSYIKACYKNNMEDIGLYPIKQFLKQKNTDLEIMSYIYYIILTDKKYKDLVIEYKIRILKYGAYFLEKGCIGKYYYTIYKYMLNFIKENTEEEKKIMDILYPNNFLYEIYVNDNNSKTILVKDYELDNIKEYNIKNNLVYIEASSNNFYYYVFSEDKKELLNCKIKINRLVEKVSLKYFYRFYKRGYRDKFTLINTVKYYLSCDKLEDVNVQLLQEVLRLNDISISFKMEILLMLGNYSFYFKNYNLATDYYKKIIEKYINDEDVNNIISCYIICKEYDKALELIKKKQHILHIDTLFFAIKNISQEEKYHKEIAIFSYNLLLNLKIDNIFIDIVLKYYKGGFKEWIELRKSLEIIGVSKKELDIHILELTIYTHSINKYSEKIFVNFYNEYKENEIIEYFLNYCMYEALNGDYIFSDEMLCIMEDIFNKTSDNLIGYALGHIYLKGNYELENKSEIIEKIIKNMEQDKISFKIFENNKDKFKNFSYLYKNKPFIYNASPNKEVYLCYKNVNEDKFIEVKMDYFKYGMYITILPIFYGEDIEYYFVENMESGNITTKRFFTTNNKKTIYDVNDEYFKINNAFIYTYEGKYDEAEKVIKDIISKDYNLKGKLL